ncbi:MAG TPA: hypothetical protein EYG92_11955 [Lutibacter sp.]|nr:hypothetical protein [Lutibacter sp.]
MLARFFKKSDPLGFISLLVLLAIYIGIQMFMKVLVVNNITSFAILVGLFVFFSSFIIFLDFIIKKNNLTPLNYYAIFIFVLLIGLFPSVLSFSKVSYSYFFILLAARRIYSIQTKKQLLLKLFDSGFYVGIAFLLFPSSGLFLFLILVSYSIYIHVIGKDVLLPIIGFFTPIFIAFTYFFITDNVYVFRSITELNISFDYRVFSDRFLYVPLLAISIFCFFGLIKLFSNRHELGVQWKNSNKLVLFHLLIGIVISLTSSIDVDKTILFIFLPVSILIGNLVFLIQKYWIKQIILFTLLALTFALPFI